MNIIEYIRDLLCGKKDELELRIEQQKKVLRDRLNEINSLKDSIIAKDNAIEDVNKLYNMTIDKRMALEVELEQLKTNIFKFEKLEEYAEIWNSKHSKAILTYKGRLFPNSKKIMNVPLQVFITPHDPVIISDIDKYNLTVTDPVKCDDAIFKIYKFTRNNPRNPYRYAYDSVTVGVPEFWMFPFELRYAGKGDCFPEDTLLLDESGELVFIKDISIGDKIFGGSGEIVTVKNKWDRGEKKILHIQLNNGDILRLSDKHKLIVAKTKHAYRKGEFVEKKAHQLNIGDSLPHPDKLNFKKTISFELETAKLFGLYIADGWVRGNRVTIAGRDGKKKEQQKIWIKEYCDKRDIDYILHERYITIKSSHLATQIKKIFGTGSSNKSIQNLNFDIETATAILDGWKADATERVNELTYSTINPGLTIALRILWRICGYQVAIKKIDKHGGFGVNPIYRITVHRKKTKRVVIKSITESEPEYCYDISTTDGLVYLPQYDIITRQCDDFGNELASYLIAAGVPGFRVRCAAGNCRGYNGCGHLTTYVLADDMKTWIHCNSTMPPKMLKARKLSDLPTSKDEKDLIGLKKVWFSYNDQHAWSSFEGTKQDLERLKKIMNIKERKHG